MNPKWKIKVVENETRFGRWHVVLKFANSKVFMHSEKYTQKHHATLKAKQLFNDLNESIIEE